MQSAAPNGTKSSTFAAASNQKWSKYDVSKRRTALTTSPSSEISTTWSPLVGPNVRTTMRTNDASKETFRRMLEEECCDSEREALARTQRQAITSEVLYQLSHVGEDAECSAAPSADQAQSRYGMTSFSRGSRSLSGLSCSYGRDGRFTKDASADPTFVTACQTPAGMDRSARSWLPK